MINNSISMINKNQISGIITFVLSLIVVIYWALLKTNFNFTYPLDDSYIHLAIAKNLAQHGVWGVTKFEFTSASSSPLYTVIIATLIKIFGNNQNIPLLLNIGIGFGIVTIASKFIQEQFSNIPKVYQYLVLNCFILFLPLHTLVFLAMEHTLHCLFVLLLFREFYYYLNGKITNQYFLPLFAFLALSTRYETLFILPPIGLVLLYRKNYKLLLLIVLASSISLFGFGAYFISQGGRLLPYSVLLKGALPKMNNEGLVKLVSTVIMKVKSNEGVNAVAIYSFVNLVYLRHKNQLNLSNSLVILLLSVFSISLAHTIFAGPGYFFRYESYIIVLIIILLPISFDKIMNNENTKMIILLLIPFIVLRTFFSFIQTPFGSQNIYEQQVQMAKYVKQHPEIKSVAINDIGAITYFNDDIRILDLWGMATKEVGEYDLWEKKSILPQNEKNKFKQILIAKLMKQKNVTYVIAYPKFFIGVLPENCIPYKSAVISSNYVCSDSVVFYYKVIN